MLCFMMRPNILGIFSSPLLIRRLRALTGQASIADFKPHSRLERAERWEEQKRKIFGRDTKRKTIARKRERR